MKLKFRYQTNTEIPEEHAPLYVQRDGGWVLDVDGVVEKGKMEEVRNSHAAVVKQLEEERKRFEGIEPDQVKGLLEEKRKLEEAQALKDGEVEKLIEGRIRKFRGELEKQLSAVASERDGLNARLTEIQINQGVIEAASKRGLRRTAIPDVVARARNVFRLNNGAPTAFEGDGKTVRMGKDGITPMTLEEWAEGLVQEAPHLFEPSTGGGAPGIGVGGAERSVKNPFRKETWNLTEQMRLQKTDPKLAARLEASA